MAPAPENLPPRQILSAADPVFSAEGDLSPADAGGLLRQLAGSLETGILVFGHLDVVMPDAVHTAVRLERPEDGKWALRLELSWLDDDAGDDERPIGVLPRS